MLRFTQCSGNKNVALQVCHISGKEQKNQHFIQIPKASMCIIYANFELQRKCSARFSVFVSSADSALSNSVWTPFSNHNKNVVQWKQFVSICNDMKKSKFTIFIFQQLISPLHSRMSWFCSVWTHSRCVWFECKTYNNFVVAMKISFKR